MKLKISETVTREVEVELPAYMKSNCHFYNVYSEEKCIQVCTLEGYISISIIPSEIAFSSRNIPCQRENFDKAFDEISNKFKSY